eukprot:GHVS01028225.1.p1 GENE.GHVS01028225.1~~GHVS01028225.1.p1  ORF type:complete len:116 (+),score=7.14 GHVS01028225.1:291-638(+)
MPSLNPPVHGGPVYWFLRNNIGFTHGRLSRYWRYWRFNHDFSRAHMDGIPKQSFNPRANDWQWSVDYGEWRGAGSWLFTKYMWLRFWASISCFVYIADHRLIANGKWDVFKKKKE